MRILSGIQPTGSKHIGNLIGAIEQYVRWQDEGDALYLIVDLHALTVQPDPAALREQTLDTAALLLAAGLDPQRCTLLVQSHLGDAHSELAWMLQCIATYGELQRMTQFKDKSDGKKSVSVGLFTYPVLQAADIVLYDTDVVPVGEDQRQHLELARDVAQRCNARYGDILTVPKTVLPKVGARIMDLQDPTRKMSTSDGTEKGTVFVVDEPKVVEKKVKSAVTDSGSEVRPGPGKEGVTNLLEIMSAVTGRDIDTLVAEFEGQMYGSFKQAVADALVAHLSPIRERYLELRANPADIEAVLAEGADRVRERAYETVARVREAMGCLPAASRIGSGR